MRKKEKTEKIIQKLKKMYPEAQCGLDAPKDYRLLISTILSAQTTDVIVNKVTSELFKKFTSLSDFAEADIKELENSIKRIGLYRGKAKNIKNASKILLEEYNGEIPNSIKELTKLPGVGRKTANVVLGEIYGKSEGIVVDTHVKRISQRLGLTKEKSAEKIEKDLLKTVPKEERIMFSHYVITHGRTLCKARKPECSECSLKDLCSFFKENSD